MWWFSFCIFVFLQAPSVPTHFRFGFSNLQAPGLSASLSAHGARQRSPRPLIKVTLVPASNPPGSLMHIHTSANAFRKLQKCSATAAAALSHCSVPSLGPREFSPCLLASRGWKGIVNLPGNDKADAPGALAKGTLQLKNRSVNLDLLTEQHPH